MSARILHSCCMNSYAEVRGRALAMLDAVNLEGAQRRPVADDIACRLAAAALPDDAIVLGFIAAAIDPGMESQPERLIRDLHPTLEYWILLSRGQISGTPGLETVMAAPRRATYLELVVGGELVSSLLAEIAERVLRRPVERPSPELQEL